MKWIFAGIGIIAAAAGIIAAAAVHRKNASTDCIDGGVVHHNSGSDSPKNILSTEITEFKCTFSLIAIVDPLGLENGVYTLKAVLTDNKVVCSLKWHDRIGGGDNRTFDADLTFLEKLQSIVSSHDLAKHNGYSHTVSGLPDMYGATLDIKYASGESIYAHDNQHVFLSNEVMKEIFDLFNQWKN